MALVITLILVGVIGFGGLLPGEQNKTRGDVFTGHIVNSPFVGIVEGTVQADKDCSSADGMMYTCTAVIEQPGGTLYFHYTHNMHAQPCLAQGNRVLVSAQPNGAASVTRLS